MKKELLLSLITGSALSGCTMINETFDALECNRQAIEMSTQAICENIQAIEEANRSIEANRIQIDKINSTLKKASES